MWRFISETKSWMKLPTVRRQTPEYKTTRPHRSGLAGGGAFIHAYFSAFKLLLTLYPNY